MAYRWTFGKDPLNLEEFCEQSTIKYDIINYLLKTTAFIENYITI